MPSGPSSTESPSTPRKPTGRRAKGCAVIVLAGALIVSGYYLFAKFQGERAWQAYAADAKARGIKLDFADYIPPKVPDAENFASIPIFEAAFHTSEKEESEAPDPFKLPRAEGDILPPFSDQAAEKPIDLKAWQQYFVKSKMIAKAGDDPAADVLQALERFAEPLAQFHEAAKRPQCQFPIHWEKGFYASLPHGSILQGAARIYTLRMAAHLAAGDSAAAYEDFHDGWRLNTAMAHEPLMISGLIRLSLLDRILSAFWDGLSRQQWKEAELSKIQDELSQTNLLADDVFMLNSERARANLTVDSVIQDPAEMVGVAYNGLTKFVALDPSDRLKARLFLLIYPTGWHYQSKARINRFIDELVARIDPQDRRYHGERPTLSARGNITSFFEGLRVMLFTVSAPVYVSVEQKWMMAAVMLDQARIACALERYRLAHQHFPQALSELSPEFIPSVPMDVVNGEPYRYRLTQDGDFVLYSVGLDLHDDGGVFDPKLSHGKQRDWIWSYPKK